MAAVSRREIRRLLALPRLETRSHPGKRSKMQYRYLDNAGQWRWGPRSVRRAPSDRCFQCGEETVFVQDGDGRIYSVCERCSERYVEWSPSLAYELRRDNGAGWRRAVNGWRSARNG